MRPTTPSAARLGVFWFGIQAVWGALLGVSLQARASELAPHAALASYALLASAGAALAGATQIAAGIVSDARRRRASRRIEFYVSGTIVSCAALLWFYTAADFRQLFASVLLLQAAMNVAIGPYQAAIPDFFDDRRVVAASSWMAALQSAGNAAGAVLAGTVANARIAALAIAALLAASCGISVRHASRLQMRPALAEQIRITRGFADLFVSRALVWLGFYTLLGYLYFLIAATVRGDARFATSITLLVVTAAGVLGASLAARAANLDRRLLANAGGGAFALALLALVFFGTSITVIRIDAAIAGAAWGVFLAADWALGCALLPRNLLATAMGVWNLAIIIPQSAAPALATLVLHALHRTGAPRPAFALAAVEVTLGLAWIWRVPASNVSVNTRRGGNTA